MDTLALPPRPTGLSSTTLTAARTCEIGDIARRAGVPFLIDPQTNLLHDRQHPRDDWAALPFAD